MCHAYVPVLIKIVYVYSWSSNLNNLLKARNNLRLVPHLVVGFLYILLCLNDELKPFPLGHCMCKESVWQKTKQRRSTNWHKSLHNQSVGLSVGLSVPPPKKKSPSHTYIYACPNLYSVQPSLHVNRWAKNLLTQLFGAFRRLPSGHGQHPSIIPYASTEHNFTLEKIFDLSSYLYSKRTLWICEFIIASLHFHSRLLCSTYKLQAEDFNIVFIAL